MTIKDRYAYKSIDVAKYIIMSANQKRIGINVTKVQKLLFICYGTWMALKEYRLTDERPQAWQYGPLFYNTWKELSTCNFSDINDCSLDGDVEENIYFQKLLDVVLNKFGDWNATMLVNWSHKESSPWSITKNKPNFKWGDIINDDTVHKFFSKSFNPQ